MGQGEAAPRLTQHLSHPKSLRAEFGGREEEAKRTRGRGRQIMTEVEARKLDALIPTLCTRCGRCCLNENYMLNLSATTDDFRDRPMGRPAAELGRQPPLGTSRLDRR